MWTLPPNWKYSKNLELYMEKISNYSSYVSAAQVLNCEVCIKIDTANLVSLLVASVKCYLLVVSFHIRPSCDLLVLQGVV